MPAPAAVLVTHPDTYVPERRYVLDVVLRTFLGLSWRGEIGPRPGFTLQLSGGEETGSLHVADGLFALASTGWLTPAAIPPAPLRVAALGPGPALPILHETGVPAGREIMIDSDETRIGVDLFGAIFFQLTRYEEVAAPARDAHGRYPPEASLAWRSSLLGRAVVDEQVALLSQLMRRRWPRLPQRAPKFRQLLSHDIDFPLHPQATVGGILRTAGGDLLRRRSPGLAVVRARAIAARLANQPDRDPFFSFDFIMEQSERRGLRSAFYFMPGCTNSEYDSAYRVSDPPIERVLLRIHERGHEIGLHPTYGSFEDPAAIARELEMLVETCARLGIEQPAWGGRQHFLRWENPRTWAAWEDAGLAYDSSLGYARLPGFRCGTSHEYPVFDLLARRQLRLRERPLVVMDLACLDPEPGRAPASAAELRALRERCRSHGGDFTLLWHNTRLVLPRERRIYQAVI